MKRYVIHTDPEQAKREIDALNEATAHLWHDGLTQRLVNLETNYDNTLFMYVVIDRYEQYYPKDILERAVRQLPETWYNKDEII